MRRTIHVAVVIAAACVTPRAARAQAVDLEAAAGARVRVTWCDRVGDHCELRHRAAGTLLGNEPDGLRLRFDGDERLLPWPAVERVEVQRGAWGASRTIAFGVLGLLLGGVSGAALGNALQGDCIEFGCLAGGFTGLVVGGATGMIAGAWIAIHSRARWATSYEAAPESGPPQAPPPPLTIGLAIPLRR